MGEAVRYLLAAPPSPRDKDHSVHTIHGNGLRPDVWRRFRDRFGITTIFEVFNSTEGMFPLANTARGDFFANAVGHHGWLMRRRFQDIYVPVRIDAATGEVWRDPVTGFCQRVPYEEGGEILVRNDVRPFHGYFNDKKATEKKLLRDVFVKGDCYYSTGDALRRDSDGRWFFLDRLVQLFLFGISSCALFVADVFAGSATHSDGRERTSRQPRSPRCWDIIRASSMRPSTA